MSATPIPPSHTGPPTLDPVAAARWLRLAQRQPSAWLHEEVARRMVERLDWIRLQPASWLHWAPHSGGIQADMLLRAKYPKSESFWHVAYVDSGQKAIKNIAKPWYQRLPWLAPSAAQGLPKPRPALSSGQQVNMLWANMALHTAAQPDKLLRQWQSALAVDGFLMFSALGPDTCRSLRALYADLGWGPSAHELTDMHDWGDMLVQAGFAQPVMDMERINLSFASPERALQELRELGRNLHPARHPSLRGRAWQQRQLAAMRERLAGADGQLVLTFEVIYGHALKPVPRVGMSVSSAVSLEDMRSMLAQRPR